MFSTFTTSNFDTPLETKTVEITTPKIDSEELSNEAKMKQNSRSRFGCLTCRKKKKRCDEMKPVCGLCLKQKHSCHWKIPGTERRNRKRQVNDGDLKQSILGVHYDHKDHNMEPRAGKFNDDEALSMTVMSPGKNEHNGLTPLIDFSHNANELVKSPSFFIALQDILNPRYDPNKIESNVDDVESSDKSNTNQIIKDNNNISLRFLHTPSSNLTKGLDDEAIYFLDYYRTCVATTVSIAPVESNYFLNFYIPLASVEKSVLFAIIGWGGMFMKGSKDNVAYSYYIKSAISLYRAKLKGGNLNKDDVVVLLTTLTILLAAEVCVGDVKQWYVFFEELYQIIKSYGLKTLIRDFGHSNELRWLILNFLYHDVLASRSIKHGTHFKTIEYQEALQAVDNSSSTSDVENFTLEMTETDYGADPLQGCVKPLYMIIGEIINISVDLKRESEQLDRVERDKMSIFKKQQQDQDSNYMFTNFECISLKQQRYELYNKTESEFKRLDNKIINSKPNDIALSYLNNDLELELHLTLFEAYQLTAQLYLRTLVLKRPPFSSDMQRLLYNLTNCIDILIGSKVQASLCFPLLVAGLQCVSEMDRMVMSKRFDHMILNFPVMNFNLVKKILDEAWLKNDKGERCVDWSEITEEFGWDLCVS